MYAGHLPEEMKIYLSHVEKHFDSFDSFSRQHGGTLIPNFQPGYDDRALRGGQRLVVERR